MPRPHDIQDATALLRPGRDPGPVELVAPDALREVLLVCEHAGTAIPESLGALGLGSDARRLHIAYDIGAGDVARDLAGRLGCRLILQRYSRLVIDCNRPPGTAASIPEISDHHPIPGNRGLSPGARALREEEIFAPYARLCMQEVARPPVRFAFSIHSFTPRMDGRARPWDIGFLFRHERSRGAQLARLCRQQWPGLTVGLNHPYTIDDETDWFIPVCAEPRGIAHCLIEIRNDHLLTAAGCRRWASRLHRLLSEFMEMPDDPHT